MTNATVLKCVSDSILLRILRANDRPDSAYAKSIQEQINYFWNEMTEDEKQYVTRVLQICDELNTRPEPNP